MSTSTSTSAAGNATRRAMVPSGGVASPTNPARSEKISRATGQPATVKSNIQSVAGVDQVKPTRTESQKRCRAERPSMMLNQAPIPIRLSGHQPQGGRPLATSRPAIAAVSRG